MKYHQPVLLNESVEGLAIKAGGVYVDLTYGGGGHSLEILKRLKGGTLIAFDQDQDAMENRINDDRLILVNNNFRYLKNLLRYHDKLPVDGILADLGVSSHQLDIPERGFTTRMDGTIDLRMDKEKNISAINVLNEYDEEKLIKIFRQYGELSNAYKLTLMITRSRKNRVITGIDQFKEIIKTCAPKGKENKYYALVFQALRIEVNQELEALREMLLQTPGLLNKGGRLVVISYHSLEDRLVKNFIKTGNFEGNVKKDFFGNRVLDLKTITRKPVVPGEKEVAENPRSRSAKLRIAEKL